MYLNFKALTESMQVAVLSPTMEVILLEFYEKLVSFLNISLVIFSMYLL